ncbi:MAG: DUF4935 domain-containing protein [Anaerolineae bacterium]|nr:DUF4935 domain-containing protein [Anaerolineae bacterium]
MRSIFPNYYELIDEHWEELWNKCIFILDTNVLLNLYRYNKATSDDLLQVLTKISDRLWIPHQVALEYQENRQNVTIGQINKYTEVENVLTDVRETLQDKLASLKLEERHYSIDPNRLLTRIESVFTDFSKELKTLRQAQPSLLEALVTEIDSLFEGKVGPPPASQDQLDELYKEAKNRFQQKRPPGYMDKEKEKDQSKKTAYFYNNLYFLRQYGDLILWYQIIDYAKSQKIKHIILVTDEHKEDWWRKIGGKQIGPRLELIDEISSKAGVEFFHMYNSARFMSYAKKHFGLDIKQESIDQVREVTSRVVSVSSLQRTYKLAEETFLSWLQSRYPEDQIIQNSFAFPDIIRIDHESQAKIGYEIKMLRRMHHMNIRRLLRDLMYRGYFEVNESRLDEFVIVIIFDKVNVSDEIPDTKSLSSDFELPRGVSIIFGELALDGKSDTQQAKFYRYSQQLSLF